MEHLRGSHDPTDKNRRDFLPVTSSASLQECENVPELLISTAKRTFRLSSQMHDFPLAFVGLIIYLGKFASRVTGDHDGCVAHNRVWAAYDQSKPALEEYIRDGDDSFVQDVMHSTWL